MGLSEYLKPHADSNGTLGVKKNNYTIKERLVHLGGVFPMDDAVLEALPRASSFVSVEHCSESAFTITGKVVARGKDGEQYICFLKVAFENQGKTMLRGEYESSKVVHSIMADFLPTPYGFGRYKVQDPPTYFYLSEFVDMDVTKRPDPAEFTRRLAQLHKLSESPTGKFGFAVQTCDGQVARTVDWEDSWAVFFRKLLLGVCQRDVETNGPWPEMERATKQIADAVIPRLLGPLQEKGGGLKPCLIHGDLWEGNMGIVRETDRSILFDVGSYYAHNEMELGHWRCEFSSVFRDKAYTEAYLQNYPPAEPTEEFDDRNRLYSLQGAINYSAGHPKSSLRKTAYNNMCYLCEKYAPIDGIDEYDSNIDPSITGATITPHVTDIPLQHY
ncbi:Fructosamine kinase-domain-containing protein [Apiospora arundinis]